MELNKFFVRCGYILVTGVLLAANANADIDFTPITSAVDATKIVAAISAIAAIKVLPNVARWGYNKVINWFN